jgi:hypothetical protein
MKLSYPKINIGDVCNIQQLFVQPLNNLLIYGRHNLLQMIVKV